MVTILNSALEACHPWTLRAWPTLLWQVNKQIPLPMRHLRTQITSPGDLTFRSMGQTFWAWHSDDGEVGMAWDWVQLGPGVLAMADPMAVVTNLRLVGNEGTVLSPWEAAPHFNHIVHSLPWQREVERLLGCPALTAAGAERPVAAAGARMLQ